MYRNPTIDQQIKEKYKEIAELKKQQVALAKSAGLQEVANYSFKNKDGQEVTLEQLFGDKDELIIIHNMGKSCPYCTLWADGLSSVTPHIESRSGFALISPNDWETMRDFAAPRQWQFSYLSAADSSFIDDMGFRQEYNGKMSYMPGFTTFLKQDGKIYRVAYDYFGPSDFYAPIWHFIDMLHHSDREWHPKFSYV